MALAAAGTVTIDENGDHSGSGMALDLFVDRKAAMAGILSQPAVDPVPLLVWLAADSVATAVRIHTWLTEDAELEVESPSEGTLPGVIT